MLSLVLVGLIVIIKADLFHAQCEMELKILDEYCIDVNASIIQQVDDRNGFDQNCKYVEDKNEFCGYSMQEITTNELHLQHETPTKHYIDDIYFTFKGKVYNKTTGSFYCVIDGLSKSQAISYYDYDTNYCNMFNLFRDGNSSQLNFYLTIDIKSCKFHPEIDNIDWRPSYQQCDKY